MRLNLIAGLLLSIAGLPALADEAETPSEPVGAEVVTAPANCLRETGTRIKPAPGRCNNAPGVVYDTEDLRMTGKTDAGTALRNLDPRIGTGVR